MLLGISSLGGGAGKTTAALHLARYAAAKGKRVLLLNVDPVQEYALLHARPEPGAIAPLAQLLYYLRKDQAGDPLPLNRIFWAFRISKARISSPRPIG